MTCWFYVLHVRYIPFRYRPTVFPVSAHPLFIYSFFFVFCIPFFLWQHDFVSFHCSFTDQEEAHVERNKGVKDEFWQDSDKTTMCQWTYDFNKQAVGHCRGLVLLVEYSTLSLSAKGLGGGLSDSSVQGKCFLIPRLFSLSLISIIVSCPPWSYYLSCPFLYPRSLPHLASSLLCFYILLSFPSPSSLCLQSTNTRDLVKQLEEARGIEWDGWQHLPVTILTPLYQRLTEVTPLLLCKVKVEAATAPGVSLTWVVSKVRGHWAAVWTPNKVSPMSFQHVIYIIELMAKSTQIIRDIYCEPKVQWLFLWPLSDTGLF